MSKALILKYAIASTALVALEAFAANTYFEARNDAMGGTGVASSHYSVAPLSNPALLAKYQQNDLFSFYFPSIGLEGNLPNGLNYPNDNQTIIDILKKNNDLAINGRLGSSFVLAVPTNTLSVALMTNIYGVMGAQLNITDADIEFLEKEKGKGDENYTFTSSASGKFAMIAEVGLTFAKGFDTDGMIWGIGITPKYQCVGIAYGTVKLNTANTPDSNSSPWDMSDAAINNNCSGVSAMNADIGGYLELAQYADFLDSLTVGVAVQNVVPHGITAQSSVGNSGTFNIRPQATAGVALSYSLLNFALDVDLSQTSGFSSDRSRQFARVGAELDLFKWVQFRTGYRYNMLSNTENVITAGLGFSPFDVVHFDVAAMGSKDLNNLGVVGQLKFTF